MTCKDATDKPKRWLKGAEWTPFRASNHIVISLEIRRSRQLASDAYSIWTEFCLKSRSPEGIGFWISV